MALYSIPGEISKLWEDLNYVMGIRVLKLGEKVKEGDNEPYFETEQDKKDAIETIVTTIESLGYEASVKCEWIIKCMKNADADIAGLKQEEDRLSKRRKALENSNGRWKQYLTDFMEGIGEDKFEAGTYKMAMQNNAKTVQVDVAPEDLPVEFQKVTVEAKKTELKKALEAGTLPEGIAHFEQTRSLRIR